MIDAKLSQIARTRAAPQISGSGIRNGVARGSQFDGAGIDFDIFREPLGGAKEGAGALAQHHGYPTPLLDWTKSPFIGAYFAFRNLSPQVINEHGHVRIFVFDGQ